MQTPRCLRYLAIAAIALLPLAAAAAGTPQAFTATYQVLRHGASIGTSTLTLRADGDGTWTYASRLRGTSGLAGLLGASVDETSRLRWRDQRPETMSYDYRMHTALKNRQRQVRVYWKRGQVQVRDGDREYSYATSAGMVERHSMPLALGYALADGQRKVTLPVAVKDRVQVQRYAVTGSNPVTVPAGHFDALRVIRTDDDRNFSAWYVPDRYPVPVKLAQRDGGDVTMLLQSFRRD